MSRPSGLAQDRPPLAPSVRIAAVDPPCPAHLAPRCAEIQAAAFRHGERPWRPNALRSAIEGPGALTRVAEIKGEVQAFGVMRVVADEAELLTLARDARFRGWGLGRSVLDTLIRDTQRHSVKRLFLEVSEINVSAINLYEMLGFQQIGRRPEYYTTASGARVAALSMRFDA